MNARTKQSSLTLARRKIDRHVGSMLDSCYNCRHAAFIISGGLFHGA
jgi:hypothetical protein